MKVGASGVTEEQRTRILDVAQRYGAHDVRLFGSRARGEAGPASDVDLLVRFEPGATLLTVISLKQDLEEALGSSVDVVEESGLSPLIAERILGEAIAL